MEKCEYCGRDVEDVESTATVGHYCIDCLKLVVSECNAAIRRLKARNCKQKVRKATTEEQVNDAFNSLINGPEFGPRGSGKTIMLKLYKSFIREPWQ